MKPRFWNIQPRFRRIEAGLVAEVLHGLRVDDLDRVLFVFSSRLNINTIRLNIAIAIAIAITITIAITIAITTTPGLR